MFMMSAPALWSLVLAVMLEGASGFSPLLRVPALQTQQFIRPASSSRRSLARSARPPSRTCSLNVVAVASLVRPTHTSSFFDGDSVGQGDDVVVKWVAHIDGKKVESSEVGQKTTQNPLFAQCSDPALPTGVVKDKFCVSESCDVADAVHRAIMGKGLGDSFEVRLQGLFPAHSEDHIYTITKDMVSLPADMPVKLGTEFKINRGSIARVTEDDGKYLVLDANHQYAGKEVVLKMTLMDILNIGNCYIDELSFGEDC